jgi:hypothetical protein
MSRECSPACDTMGCWTLVWEFIQLICRFICALQCQEWGRLRLTTFMGHRCHQATCAHFRPGQICTQSGICRAK